MLLAIFALLSVGPAIGHQDSFCVWQTGATCPPRTADEKPLKLSDEQFEKAKAALGSLNAPAAPVMESSTLVAVDMDAQGRMTNCRIVESSGTAELDASVCPNVLKNARVGGAPGADGRFVPATRRLRIRWHIEG